MSATTWVERPPEQARLLNPAFVGATIWSCARGYASVRETELPYALAFVGFAERARAVVPLVKEGILFASCGQLLMLDDARLTAADRPRSMALFEREATDEVKACVKKAEFVGKWFAGSGDYATVMALWGVAP